MHAAIRVLILNYIGYLIYVCWSLVKLLLADHSAFPLVLDLKVGANCVTVVAVKIIGGLFICCVCSASVLLLLLLILDN